MWNTISRFFAKGKTAAVVQETAPSLPPSPTTRTTAARNEQPQQQQQQQQQSVCNGVADDDAPAATAVHVFYDATMDRGASADDRRRPAAAGGAASTADQQQQQQQSGGGDPEHFPDAYDSRQAKQRASVKWLLSKAYNNRVPEKLREPYYRDHEEQEHLKPQIVHALSNAELYCLALANIYSDPNYHNQNHCGILQALARKGVYVAEQNNTQLTETILIQNSPLKMSAHMAVIEGLMVLYAKEVVTGDRVVSAIRRFDPQAEVDVPSDHEKGLLLWINHASHALIAKIQTEEGAGDKTRLPELPAAKDFQSLCDGVGLAAVVAFYCPSELNWIEIRVSKRPSVADALHNLSLVHAFCVKCLPYSIFHMQPEDVTYMRGSMKQNLVVFLADMYNVLEIHPAKCVRYPGEERAMQYLDVAKSAPSATVKKSQSLQQTTESRPYDDRRAGSEESFVVHRGKGVPTLSSVADEKSAARAEAAGRPSNWEEQRRSSYAGRRSRRNSITDDSQLTIENFGGSQDNLHNFGRNPDKEVGAHIGKRSTTEPTLPARSSVQDVYGSGVQHILSDNGYGVGEEPSRLRRQASNSSLDNVALRQILHSSENDGAEGGGEAMAKMASFANLSRQSSEKGINFTYTEQEREDTIAKPSLTMKKHGQSNGNGNGEKKTTFATLPNTTTWQQQSSQQSQQMEQHSADENGGNTVMASQLNNIRLKLEEKRRHIENEKRRMEVVMSKQRQKVGKAAFLQAVTKGKVKSPSSSTSGGDSPAEIGPPTPVTSGSSGETPTSVSEASSVPQQPPQEKPQRPFSLKEISEDVRDVEHKWLEHDGNAPFIETRRTPDIENMDPEQYRQSITQMNNSLSEIQADIQRLTNQQNQIQQQHLMSQHQKQMQQQLQQLQSLSQQHMQSYGMPPMNPLTPRLQDPQQSQFYLHDQPQIQRRMWGQPPPAQSLANEMAVVGYQQSMDSRFSPQPAAYQQDMRMYADPTRTWAAPHPTQKGFVLHDTQEPRYLNGGDHSLCNNQMSHPGPTYPASSSLFNQTQASSASPQHRNAVHRISQLISESPEPKRSTVHHIPISCESPTEKRQVTALHTPVPAPPADDMKPQNISFIGNDDDIAQGIRGLNITSGSRTYRIPSPTRPTISQNSFQPHPSLREAASSRSATPDVTPLDPTDAGEKGFYISFDNDTPKKPKPTLRVKRSSPKKERSVSSYIEHEDFTMRPESPPASAIERQKQMEAQRELERERLRQAEEREHQRQEMRDRELKREMERERQREKQRDSSAEGRHSSGVGLVIGNQLTNPDPNSMDEMEKKKERIMLLSLQRRQRQEEMKERKEAEAQAHREQEKLKAEERARKKEEERQRRAAILEHHKVKKAIEEAEREGKVIDKELLNAINPAKLRNKTATARPRPKTIHGDAGAVLDSGALTPSRGKKGSSSNLSTASLTSPTMRRDYYRGSQDSLTAAHLDDRRSGPLYRGGSLRVSSVDSPDDGRGSSPCRSVNQLGRRGSYKTSRDAQESQQQVRGRPKYQTYQNFKGRKSNSLMNLCDSDSGLGRSTPPRRAASPGIGSMRHLTSPSGPGSLPPALMTSKKRVYDDGSSDISSTPSSMMDYNGPRLYKLPIAKSNRNIMLNAVEYCVFPGTVNKEAKSRVLEEIGRSESKHFLILFRDAGCQFRALYSYCPEREEVAKLYGTGPKQVIDNMFDKFFKYNSSGKCFSQVHTKHLTVTIDAFTIHNSLWQGKKVNLPNKKDIPLVI
ncbi:patronin isoform X3 [Harpegnathos saltator]|uniref:patronin isoform X3 n=1 Tax=Harpegnathos saltator TaxID=610380 RepID=UPI00058B814C|nr:patronin isoform X3 [Harpegnathos saltator]